VWMAAASGDVSVAAGAAVAGMEPCDGHMDRWMRIYDCNRWATQNGKRQFSSCVVGDQTLNVRRRCTCRTH